jgi:hypothetical protein
MVKAGSEKSSVTHREKERRCPALPMEVLAILRVGDHIPHAKPPECLDCKV